MNLGQFCLEYGLSCAKVTKEEIISFFKAGKLTQRQADKLLAELNWIDSIWQISLPEVKCSFYLW